MVTKGNRLIAAGPFLRDIIFGTHDALLTNIGIITGFATALGSHQLILIAVMIDIFISAFAMAFGTYLSRTSESDYLAGQLEHETHSDLQAVLARPVPASIVMWLSYVVCGIIPLIPFFFNLPLSISIRLTITITLLVFFAVGLLKGVVTGMNSWKSGLQFTIFGTVAATIGYLIGLIGQQFLC